MRKLLPLVVTLWCACEPVTLPVFGTPHVLSVTPEMQDSTEPVVIQVQLDQEPRFRVDYGKGAGERLEQATLWVGKQAVPLDTYLGHGVLQGILPAGLEPGHHDLRVTLEDGREATWAAGYQVTPEVDFYVDTIPLQHQDQPFTVTLHATGTGSDFFQGTATVELCLATCPPPLTSMRTGAFSAGVRQEQFTLSTPGPNYIIVVHRGAAHPTSNQFQVDPP